MTNKIDVDQARAMIDYIADVADRIGMMSATGGMEMAGLLISYLKAHSELVGEFLETGPGFFVDRFPKAEEGVLSWHTRGTGEVITPAEFLRREHPEQLN